MTPTARLSAVIEILEKVELSLADAGQPADRLLSQYFRERRYAGSGDRRAVAEGVYAVIRNRGMLMWALEDKGLPQTARSLQIACMAFTGAEADGFGADAPYAPDALTEQEEKAYRELRDFDWTEAPLAARLNIPEWAADGLGQRYGRELPRAMAAMNGKASVDIRVNVIKRQATYGPGLQNFVATPMSPFGFRATQPVQIRGEVAYRQGEVEIQDEAAQIASLLVDVLPGQSVIDLCAGAGGKTLAVAGQMKDRGRITAMDISSFRLEELRMRARRAGSKIVRIEELAEDAEERHDQLTGYRNAADRVIVDVPCSGSGTWRRNPELRWRYTKKSLAALRATQRELLEQAAMIVRPGGRLVYMTCSVLPNENEDMIDAFLAVGGGQNFKRVNFRNLWSKVGLKASPPASQAQNKIDLQLVPYLHATDGFYVSILERSA